MRFNAARARVILLVVVGAGFALAFAGAATPAAGDSDPGARPLTAQQRQALARARAALGIDGAARSFLWPGREMENVPLLVREARPGRAPFVLLVGHPSPPAGLSRAGTAEAPAFVGEKLDAGEGSSPSLVGGVPTALYDLGDVRPPLSMGDPSAELEILGMLHQISHVHMVAAGGPRFAHRAPPGPARTYPETTALAALESRILAEILFTAPSGKSYVEELARQFLAVRRARERLLGEAAADLISAEASEGMALHAEYEIVRLIAGRQITPPGVGEGEGAYDAFKYGGVLRMTRIFTALLETPTEPIHASARAAFTGAGQAITLDRLGIDGRARMLAGGEATTWTVLIAQELPLTPSEQEERLAQAERGFDFTALLAVARERAGE